MVTLYPVKGCKGEQVNVPSWPCNICSPFNSSGPQGGEEGAASRHMALMPQQASGNLQVQCSLMLVLEISKVSGSTRRTSVKERLAEGHCIPFQSQPGKDAAVKQPCLSCSPVRGKVRLKVATASPSKHSRRSWTGMWAKEWNSYSSSNFPN